MGWFTPAAFFAPSLMNKKKFYNIYNRKDYRPESEMKNTGEQASQFSYFKINFNVSVQNG